MTKHPGTIVTCICTFAWLVTGLECTLAGVSYLDPAGGWRYSYEGTFNAGVMDGTPGTTADNFVGDFGPAGYGKSDRSEALDGTWHHSQGSKWDGTAPGDPLSDPTAPSNPLGSLTGRQGTSPGGAGAFMDGDTTYIRVQDAGNPETHGWVQDNLDDPDGPNHPINTNRRVYFGHPLGADGALDNQLVLSGTGITLSFRIRIPDSGPIDNIYSELDADSTPGPDIIPWFDDAPHGRGGILSNGRGIINVVQNNPATNDDTLVGFGLVTSDDVAQFSSSGSGSLTTGSGSGGLIMNNLVGDAPSNSIDSESNGTLNMLEIPDAELNQWNEFWITMENNGPEAGNIEVNVYRNGSTTPNTFQVTLAAPNNAVYSAEDSPFLEFGISDNARWGSFDLDFVSYQLGVISPMTAPIENADFDADGDVDGTDLLAWQRGLGATSGAILAHGDADGNGAVNAADLAVWNTQFRPVPAGAAAAVIPEPATLAMATIVGIAAVASARRRRG